jgi:hypothetical protein
MPRLTVRLPVTSGDSASPGSGVSDRVRRPPAARAFAMASPSAPSDALEVSVTAPVTGSMIIAVRE